MAQGPLALALRLAEAGLAVTLIEADAHDARRRRDLLARAGAQGCRVRVAPSPGAALVFDRSGATPLHIHLDAGPVGNGHAVIALAAPDLSLIEVLDGSDPRAFDLVRRLGGVPLLTRDFVAPRVLRALAEAAESLVFDGSTPWEVDEAAVSAGFALGPCAGQDLRGLSPGPLPVVARMVAEGRLGVTSGVGWYRYPGGGGRVIDPLIEDLAREEAHFARHPLRRIGPDEITGRLLAVIGGADPALRRALGLP